MGQQRHRNLLSKSPVGVIIASDSFRTIADHHEGHGEIGRGRGTAEAEKAGVLTDRTRLRLTKRGFGVENSRKE
jgi:hypothetical protein